MTSEFTLQFPSMDDLWAFRIEAMIGFIDLDKERNLLICRGTTKQIELAISKYGASVVINQHRNSN
jgi:hypothetical protein